MKKKNEMTLSRPVAESASPPSLIMAKGLHLLLALAEQTDGMQARIYSAPISQIRQLTGCNDYQLLRRELLKLAKHTLEWGRLRPGWEGCTHPIPSVSFNEERGVFEWDIAPSFVEAWHQNIGGWRMVPLSVLLGFRSRFALKLFEWAVLQVDRRRKTWTAEFTDAELRVMLGCQHTLKTSGELVKDAIKPAIKEVNQPETGIRVYYSKEGYGPRTRWVFTVELQEAAQIPLPSAEVSSREPYVGGKAREIESARAKAEKDFKPEYQGVFAAMLAASGQFDWTSAEKKRGK